MKRFIDQTLETWKGNPIRKTLLVRGARQVGKTYSIRQFARGFRHYLEVNFESDREVRHFFERDLNPDDLCRNLSAYYNVPILDGETLLFFDEIQACLPAISSLRYFHERRPGLHLVAAGSLLEFALKEIPSFGVGRIETMFMFPLSFDEFLLASGQEQLVQLKRESGFDRPINQVFHHKLIDYLRQFLLLGGLPEVVKTFLETGNYRHSQVILDQLILGLEDDFARYKERIPSSRIREVFESIVYQTGGKFIISKASESSNQQQIKEALDLLEMAGLCYRVNHSAANGIPLGAEINPKKFKILLLDHGIFQRILGLNLSDYLIKTDFAAVNKGKLSEQFVGTELVKNSYSRSRPHLYYWHREQRGSNAEVDYLLQKENLILPLEVKSGTQGKMQSMRIFMKEKKISYGVRISLENFSHYEDIRVLPLYAISNLFQ